MWSTQSPAALSDIRIGWDASGTITGYQADHYMPAMQDDRLVGALIAGLPTQPAPQVSLDSDPISSTVNGIQDPWLYDRVPNVAESGLGTFQIGQKASPLADWPARSQHADAGTAAAELPARSSRSAKRPRSPASTRSSSA